jgi:5'-nucleotidase
LLRRATIVIVSAALALGACSDDESSSGTTTTVEETTTTAAPEPLSILVTNDDGIGAPGIDALVNALVELDDVEVTVVAPAENQSGSSDKTTPGGAPYADGQTASGVEGTAVDGFPADSIAVALDDLGLEPDLVVSGVNKGQNTGPLAFESGTVGAGRAAVRRDIPAIAGSAGLQDDSDYATAVALIVAFIEENRESFVDGSAPADGVHSFNVPDCTAGTVRELLEVPLATEIPEGVNPFESDCSVEVTEEPANDIAALAAGHSALTLVPPEAPTG